MSRAVVLAFREVEAAHIRRRMLAKDYEPAFDDQYAVEVAGSLRRDKVPRSMPRRLRLEADDRRDLFGAALVVVRTVLDSWPNVPAAFMQPGRSARSPLPRRCAR
ncbi:MAG: hypothetical protein KDA22_03880 [Phycisphaerales bacterium]|nr:hypothetical protein [Phycisphaerales bacterium]